MRQFSEEWRDIPSVTSQVHGVCYQASSLGNIRRATLTEPRKFGKCLKPWIDREGYAYVYPCIKFKLYTNTVHKLVAEAFLGPCPEGLEVNHKDTNKLNNRADNLEYMTSDQNIRHGISMGACNNKSHGEDHCCAVVTEEDVREIRRLRKQGWMFRQLMEKFSMSYGGIRHICVRKTWKHVK